MQQATKKTTRRFQPAPCDLCGVEAEEKARYYFDHMCPRCRLFHNRLKSKSQNAVTRAVKDGVLIRPTVCELCGDAPGKLLIRRYKRNEYRTLIVAHHANGYESPLDVWWICHACNQRMKGYQFHSGRFTREQAREYLGLADKGLLSENQHCNA